MATSIKELTLSDSDVVAGQKIFSSKVQARIDAIVEWANDQVGAKAVDLSSSQEITGAKTFDGAVIVPDKNASDNSMEAANTKYVTAAVSELGVLSPLSWAGEQSVTLQNGQITKIGYIARAGVNTVVTFETPFPNAVYNVQVTNNSVVGDYLSPSVSTLNVSVINIISTQPITGFYWQVVGY